MSHNNLTVGNLKIPRFGPMCSSVADDDDGYHINYLTSVKIPEL